MEGGDGARSGAVTGRWAFVRTPRACRAWVSAAFLCALVLPLLLVDRGQGHTAKDATVTGLVLIALSVLNVEIGRLLEGGISQSQRPHKGLSAWAFASALLLPTWWLLPVVVVTYGHAWWRGLRAPPWKWIGSAAYVVVAALSAAVVAHAVIGNHHDLMHGTGLVGLIGVVAAAATFLAVETVLFHGSAYLNVPEDEVWLRQTLRSPSFYLTEAGVLLVGGLSAAIWTGGGWFIVLLAPVYVLTQRAALHEPLRERAEHDEKTGTLRFESWRRLAMAGADRCHRREQPWCVLFADLDHFKTFNDLWGHLVGDDALAAVAAAIRAELRNDDVLGRFGGEEFCVLLPDVAIEDATGIAERIRAGVAAIDVPGGGPITISIGLGAVTPEDGQIDFVSALTAADRALFLAKHEGRNRTHLVLVDA
ncbi:GGDEF domain-containing protein [Nocardioides stalactiti]|uniref:GGDEF domain-containing protein n=1 Tax=Nocardioides stalactiti TaxID=2755356 RepID=UPI0015FF5015|nr:GGDEF domain-containing protein [Nocardioides stalactiti]